MTPEEAREYTKNAQKAKSTKRVLGSRNDWYMGRCIRKIDRSIKYEAKGGKTETVIYFSDYLLRLYDADKKYLVEHYRNQGYHVEKGTYTVRIGWSANVPWWAY